MVRWAVAAPLDFFRRLISSPADRRLASALALAPASPPLPPVPLVPASDAEGRRQRLYVDEQRQGIRTPWQPVGLRWGFEDMEPVWQSAEIGNLDPLARVIEAMRSEGVVAGLMDVRCAFLKKALSWDGDPYLCDLLRGTRSVYEGARLVVPGRKGLFRRMHPTAALRDLTYTAILGNVGAAEYVDDPATGIPVLHTRDLHRIRYDWGERAWFYRGTQKEYVVEPGNGRWILFCPKSTHRPWRSGSWLPLMLAFVVMTTTTYDAARFQAKNADPLKYIELPDSAPPDEVDRYQDFVQHWWERAPGIVLRWGAKAGLVETNGVGHHIYGVQREWAKQQINFTLRGSMGTAGESAGIFNDEEQALDVAGELIQDTADELAECLCEQGVGPALVRMGLIRHRDEAPTGSWDTRTYARKIGEAEAAGKVADNVIKLNTAAQADGKRVDAPTYLAACGLSVPWVDVATPAALPTAPPPAPDPVLAQTTPAGVLE